MAQIQLMNALDSVARVNAKDCFVEGNSVVFVVPEKDMRQAIGKNGSTVERMEKLLGRKVELFEFSQEPEKFFGKAFFKAKVEKAEIRQLKDRKIAVVNVDAENKKLILRNMMRLKKVKEIAKRNYGIDEVRIR
ncbi:MAG: NusA-like transcription termination signal-binding factor [Candidatus Diapherotrites archaeon]|uniref:NusA-like transcription termination signal-binding factor n=1 Tax=Candidatus Iainarchaeum sp. TaxID=3101447 RepID=A0A8T3YP73_9ARCH|nr:NusA-like transcription termination signal-binding factor [Candidatus Diapherotrites archaeon]